MARNLKISKEFEFVSGLDGLPQLTEDTFVTRWSRAALLGRSPEWIETR